MKPRLSIIYFIAALFALPVLGVFAKQPAALSVELLSTFDYPGDIVSTQPQKINDQGVVVGVIADSSGVRSGFLRLRKGFFSDPLVDPNDTGNSTEGRGINNDLLVCGDYLDAGSGNFHGFFLHGATFDDFDVPGSSWTIILGVNNQGEFSGSDIPSSGVQSGFVSIRGVITEFTVPGASNTLAYQINDHDVACGYYIDSAGITHGYYRDTDGSIFSPIDPAGSTGTIVFGNNSKNSIVGRYADAAGLTHGFVFIPPDQYVTYDFPGSTFTSLNGINKRGLIVGRYLDPSSGIEHGIVVRLTNGASDRPTGGAIPQRQTSRATTPQPATVKAVEPAL